MFNWFKKGLNEFPQNNSPVKMPEIKKPKSDFKIEHYPITDIYACLYKGEYLTRHYSTGIIKTTYSNDLIYAEHLETYDEALKFIEEFKQQHLKQTIEIFEVQ